MLKITLLATVLALAVAPAAWCEEASALLKSADGTSVGEVRLTEAPAGILLHIQAHGLTPGWHAMHFHEKGDCSGPAFTSAGAHVNMAGMKKPHGLLNPAGPDMGDLTNLYVAADGTGKAEVFSTLVSLHGAGGRSALLDADGSALVVHAMPDDYATQPIGGAGARVACAVIK